MLFGQQATPNAIRAMPVTRATVAAMPVSSTPSSNCPTSDGRVSRPRPVAVWATDAKIRSFFIRLVSGAGNRVGNGRKILALFFRQLLRSEIKRDCVDGACELERNVVAIF